MKTLLTVLGTVAVTLVATGLGSTQERTELPSLRRSVATIPAGPEGTDVVRIFREQIEGHDVWIGVGESQFGMTHHPECTHPVHRD